jgi:hypothetical protein
VRWLSSHPCSQWASRSLLPLSPAFRYISVADLHHVDADADPDPAFHIAADPDPTFQSDADPAPDPTCNLMRIRLMGIRIRLLLLI